MSLLTELNIDYKMLRGQREELQNLIWNDKNSNLWGLVGLLDALIDGSENGYL